MQAYTPKRITPYKSAREFQALRTLSSQVLIGAFCLAFGYLYISVIYNALPVEHWLDLRTYETLFNDPYYHYAQLNRSWLSWLKDEPLWYETVVAFRDSAWTYTETINAISIFSCALTTYIIYKSAGSKIWPVLLLINPSTIDLFIAQVRSALALSLLLIVLLRPPWAVRLLLIVIAGTIHTSMYLFGGLYVFISLYAYAMAKKEFLRSKISILAASSIVAFIISVAAPIVLGAIGDRRVSIETDAIGILFSITWFTFIVTYYLWAKLDEFLFPHFFFTICTLIGVFSIFSEVYGSRYIAVAVPMLVVMIARQAKPFRFVLLAQYCAVMLVYFYFYLQQAGVL